MIHTPNVPPRQLELPFQWRRELIRQTLVRKIPRRMSRQTRQRR